VDPAHVYELALQTLGVPGVLLIAGGYAINRLFERLQQVQDLRTEDAKTHTARMLELVQAQHRQTELLVKAIDGNADAVAELRTLLQTVLSERSARLGR
jgi:hypothetical protein